MTQLRLRQVEKVDLGPLLYPYQKTGATFLRDRRAALLCDQMGLGKAQANSSPRGSFDSSVLHEGIGRPYECRLHYGKGQVP